MGGLTTLERRSRKAALVFDLCEVLTWGSSMLIRRSVN